MFFFKDYIHGSKLCSFLMSMCMIFNIICNNNSYFILSKSNIFIWWLYGYIYIYICIHIYPIVGFPGGAGGKELPANAGVVRDTGSIAGSGISPGEGSSYPLQFLAWRIPCSEEPGRLQSIGLHRVGYNWSDLAHTHILNYVLYICLCLYLWRQTDLYSNLYQVSSSL